MLPGPAQARSTTNGPGWSIDATKTCASMPAPVAGPAHLALRQHPGRRVQVRLGTGRIATGVGEEAAAATDPGGDPSRRAVPRAGVNRTRPPRTISPATARPARARRGWPTDGRPSTGSGPPAYRAVMGCPTRSMPPRAAYAVGWGHRCGNIRGMVASWCPASAIRPTVSSSGGRRAPAVRVSRSVPTARSSSRCPSGWRSTGRTSWWPSGGHGSPVSGPGCRACGRPCAARPALGAGRPVSFGGIDHTVSVLVRPERALGAGSSTRTSPAAVPAGRTGARRRASAGHRAGAWPARRGPRRRWSDGGRAHATWVSASAASPSATSAAGGAAPPGAEPCHSAGASS